MAVHTVTSLLEVARKKGIMLTTAESCTGGMIAAALTNISGSSDVVDRAFVTYSNEAKCEMLGLPSALIANHGAVSEPVARAMATGAVAHSAAQAAVAVTGIAGPSGGSTDKPVGTVWIATHLNTAETQATHAALHHFSGNRAEIRRDASQAAIDMLSLMLEETRN